jgi:hypothetical protein
MNASIMAESPASQKLGTGDYTASVFPENATKTPEAQDQRRLGTILGGVRCKREISGGGGQQSVDLRRVKRNLATAAFSDREPEALAEAQSENETGVRSSGLDLLDRDMYCILGLVLRACLYGAYLE